MQDVTDRKERGHETFRWEYDVYDITAVLGDIERGAVRERWETTFNRDQIAQYRAFLEGVSCLGVPKGMTQQHQIHIDVIYASTLTQADLMRPIIVLHVGQGVGTIELADLEDGANFVVADGNHRLIRAYQLDVEELPVVVLRDDVARKYLCPPDHVEF